MIRRFRDELLKCAKQMEDNITQIKSLANCYDDLWKDKSSYLSWLPKEIYENYILDSIMISEKNVELYNEIFKNTVGISNDFSDILMKSIDGNTICFCVNFCRMTDEPFETIAVFRKRCYAEKYMKLVSARYVRGSIVSIEERAYKYIEEYIPNTIYRFHVYCVDDAQYEYVWSNIVPTCCPYNSSHSIDRNLITVVDNVSAQKISINKQFVYNEYWIYNKYLKYNFDRYINMSLEDFNNMIKND